MHPTVQVGILFHDEFHDEALVTLLYPHRRNLMILLNPRCQNSLTSQMSV